MRVNKAVAALAVAGAIVTAGVTTAGTAGASTLGQGKAAAASSPQISGPSWHVYSQYSSDAQCEAEGAVLLVNGAFGGPFIGVKCVANAPVNPYYWVLWAETPF